MKIGLFGGTFDPIHRGHTALAQAARETFQLARVYFVTNHIPPHKQKLPHSPFPHRHAMVALATSSDKTLVPSLLEAPEDALPGTSDKKAGGRSVRPSYSIETLRRLKKLLKPGDQIFFLIGIDAFKDIAAWYKAEELFAECEFVVASRPGYSLADVANSLPESIRPAPAVTKPFEKQAAAGDLVLPRATIHLLNSVHHAISATAIRQAVNSGRPLGKWVDASVADYIKKTGLYKRAG
jgi:nicotinate-nucleotide adenylyltransferase